VSPGVDGDVILESLICHFELWNSIDDVDANHEVSSMLVFLLKEGVELVRGFLPRNVSRYPS
jgi:hypothetical protein